VKLFSNWPQDEKKRKKKKAKYSFMGALFNRGRDDEVRKKFKARIWRENYFAPFSLFPRI
jgi:hypothetical protein